MRRGHLTEAFSLIEIVIALAILGLVMAIGVPALMNVWEAARINTTAATIQNMKTVMLQYNMDMGSYPRSLRELETRPTDERGKKWRGPYMEKFNDEDLWNNPYVYRLTPGQKNPYELYSTGPKGGDGAKEDRIGITN